MQPLDFKDNLNDIQSLQQLNALITNERNADKIITVKWATRDITLKGTDNTEYHVKMKDIVSKFKELTQNAGEKLNPDDKNAIRSIHDRLVELNPKGDYLLSQQGIGSLEAEGINNEAKGVISDNVVENSVNEDVGGRNTINNSNKQVSDIPQPTGMVKYNVADYIKCYEENGDYTEITADLIRNQGKNEAEEAVRYLAQTRPEVAIRIMEEFSKKLSVYAEDGFKMDKKAWFEDGQIPSNFLRANPAGFLPKEIKFFESVELLLKDNTRVDTKDLVFFEEFKEKINGMLSVRGSIEDYYFEKELLTIGEKYETRDAMFPSEAETERIQGIANRLVETFNQELTNANNSIFFGKEDGYGLYGRGSPDKERAMRSLAKTDPIATVGIMKNFGKHIGDYISVTEWGPEKDAKVKRFLQDRIKFFESVKYNLEDGEDKELIASEVLKLREMMPK